MTTMFAGILGGWEMILILAVILIIFGPKKLPEFARGLGQSLKEFKKASNEVVEEIQNAQVDDHHSRPNPPPKAIAAPEKTEARSANATTDASGGQPMAKLDKPVNADLHG